MTGKMKIGKISFLSFSGPAGGEDFKKSRSTSGALRVAKILKVRVFHIFKPPAEGKQVLICLDLSTKGMHERIVLKNLIQHLSAGQKTIWSRSIA